MENIWFTSDNHFSHKNISNFCPRTRPDKDPDTMNEKMITVWQEQVQPQDRVYLLGDVFFCNAHNAATLLDRLPGQKYLVYGNHDKVIRSNKHLRDRFVSVEEYKEIVVEGVQVVLFHYPILEWNRCHRGAYALFGHVHGQYDRHPITSRYRTMDVGIDSRPHDSNKDKPLYSLWSWREVNSILKDREIMTHH